MKKKIFIVTLIIIIALSIMLTATGCEWITEKWHNATDKVTSWFATDDEGEPMYADVEYTLQDIIFLSGTEPEESLTLTATIFPVEASNQEVDWSIAWNDPQSEWATGKDINNYLTITPTEDGSLTANLQCIEAFGEQAIITVVSRADNEVSATANVDYLKRVEGVDVQVTKEGLEVDFILYPYIIELNDYTLNFSVIYTVGTLEFEDPFYLTNSELAFHVDARLELEGASTYTTGYDYDIKSWHTHSFSEQGTSMTALINNFDYNSSLLTGVTDLDHFNHYGVNFLNNRGIETPFEIRVDLRIKSVFFENENSTQPLLYDFWGDNSNDAFRTLSLPVVLTFNLTENIESLSIDNEEILF